MEAALSLNPPSEIRLPRSFAPAEGKERQVVRDGSPGAEGREVADAGLDQLAGRESVALARDEPRQALPAVLFTEDVLRLREAVGVEQERVAFVEAHAGAGELLVAEDAEREARRLDDGHAAGRARDQRRQVSGVADLHLA